MARAIVSPNIVFTNATKASGSEVFSPNNEQIFSAIQAIGDNLYYTEVGLNPVAVFDESALTTEFLSQYAKCDGSSYSSADYPMASSRLQTCRTARYIDPFDSTLGVRLDDPGAGNFRVPYLTGLALVGTNPDASGFMANTSGGQINGDKLRNITGKHTGTTMDYVPGVGMYATGVFTASRIRTVNLSSASSGSSEVWDFDISRQIPTGKHAQIPSISVTYYIRLSVKLAGYTWT